MMDEDDQKYAWSNERPEEIVVTPLTEAECRPIVCSPVSGPNGVEYVPDWFGLTHFG
ncbi:MAG: hypothetical protein ACR652_17680 [Methylocystis sp.]|uniref:hypothetical protein n=1 Tax=Methylocystis sp. TaxID=1911079 RepID=UPI003DA47474